MLDKTIHFKDSNIAYRITGEGTPVMFIHGFGETGNVWDQILPGLGSTCLLIIPDLPGSGRSTPLTIGASNLEQYAEALVAILYKENLATCTLIGHSMGGYIALAIAQAYPELVSGLGLFHSSVFGDNAEKLAAREKSITFMQEHGATAFLKTSIPGLFYKEKKHAEVIDALVNSFHDTPAAVLINYYVAMMSRPDRSSVIRRATYPVLFILGVHDKAVPFDQGLRQTSMPSRAYIHILRESGHMGMFEETEKCIIILREFLETIKN
jgi:pimeloyl-ACP methyl ester carboxylesterase